MKHLKLKLALCVLPFLIAPTYAHAQNPNINQRNDNNTEISVIERIATPTTDFEGTNGLYRVIDPVFGHIIYILTTGNRNTPPQIEIVENPRR